MSETLTPGEAWAHRLQARQQAATVEDADRAIRARLKAERAARRAPCEWCGDTGILPGRTFCECAEGGQAVADMLGTTHQPNGRTAYMPVEY